MSEHEEVFKALLEDLQAPHHPQVRIYLLSGERPSAARLSGALPDYEIVLPHSNDEAAFIRQMAIGSEEQFRRECDRVAAALNPLLIADSCLGCVYDGPDGNTLFNLLFRKTSSHQKFIETDPESDAV